MSDVEVIAYGLLDGLTTSMAYATRTAELTLAEVLREFRKRAKGLSRKEVDQIAGEYRLAMARQ